MCRRRNEQRNAAGVILKLRIIVAVRFEDQFLYANFSAPHFLLAPPQFICTGKWRRHWLHLTRIPGVPAKPGFLATVFGQTPELHRTPQFHII